MPGVRALQRDFVGPRDAPIHARLGRFDAGAQGWRSAGGGIRTDLVAALVACNRALGVGEDVVARLADLAAGRVRAVLTGQQPGVMGGPLMSLHKAQTAVALAAEAEARHGIPCVPVFWLGCDDDDFAEVRDLSVLGADLSRLDVSIDAAAYRPGLRVGDMPAPPLRAAWSAVAPMLPAGEAAARLRAVAERADDFGIAAALSLVAATGGRIAVIDSREPVLRTAARTLLLDYFDREADLYAVIDAEGRELVEAGYHAQLPAPSDSGLFLVRDGVRHRIPSSQRDAARRAFDADITAASAGVVARNLVQDALFKPLAVVLGPAEIAYRAQMVGLYRAAGVAMPVVFPRLSATYAPAPVGAMLDALGLDAAGLATDPGEVARAARAAAEDVVFKDAARGFEAAFAREAGAFAGLAGERLDARARDKMERRFREISQRLSQALADAIAQDALGAETRWPFLPRLGDVFRRGDAPQERFLSMLTPLLLDGDASLDAHADLAQRFVRDALDRRVWHGVYSVP
jgi:hypothetical protein